MSNNFILQEFLSYLPLNPLIILIPVFIGFIFLCKWFLLKTSTTHPKPPPSPPRLPIIGHLHQLGTAPYRSLKSLSQKYGNLMLLHLGSTPTLVVSSATVAKEVMKTHDVIFSNRPYSRKVSKLLYDCKDVAFVRYGEYWRQMKSICVLQLLSSTRVQSFRGMRKEEVSLMVENIRRSVPEVVNLSKILITITNSIISRATFGRKYDGDKTNEFSQLMLKFMQLLGEISVRDFIPWLGWIDKLNGLDRKIDKVVKEVDVLLELVVEEHLCRLDDQGICGKDDNDEKVKDFVDVLLEAQRDGVFGIPINRDNIKAIILDMFSAGTDTTFTAMEWAMAELIKHPKAIKKLQEEVRTITQGKTGINEDDLEKMHYLKAVIKETLRLHPPGPLLVFRESTHDVNINGYYIAAQTQVIVNAWAIQRDPCFWENPEVFYPERFLSSEVDFRGHDFELIPFGAGRRGCPGIRFAMISTELILANLVYEFDWASPDGANCENLDMDESTGITIHRRHPLLAVATPHFC